MLWNENEGNRPLIIPAKATARDVSSSPTKRNQVLDFQLQIPIGFTYKGTEKSCNLSKSFTRLLHRLGYTIDQLSDLHISFF